MRMLLNVQMPHEPFNTLVRQGTVGVTLSRILDDIKPEAAYFTEQNGTRGVILIVDVKEPSWVPSIAEPFFLHFNADCHFRIVMSPEDLKKAGLEELGKKWASVTPH
ncbi:MAG: panthothenate synthetase [Bryobacteraceae bacterium]